MNQNLQSDAPSDQSRDTTDDLTRRQWLLRLGEMVALVGYSGLIPDAGALLQSAPPSVIALPPGLFDPSEHHLVNALATAKFSPPPGSQTDYVQPSPGPYHPQFFSPEEFRVITRFVEILLGYVDRDALAQTTHWLDLYLNSSAGVRDAARHLDPLHRILAVEFFGEDSVRELETFDPATIVRSGLQSLNDLSRQQHGKPFLDLAPAGQVHLIESTASAAPHFPSRKSFDVLRHASARGYYTSAKGLEDLDYQGNAFYTDCPGCDGKS